MKKHIAILCTSLILSTAFAFDFPQEIIDSDSFFSYFGQYRGKSISTSLIFKDNSQVKASDSGTLSAIISDHQGSSSWFESTLGNAVIISHKDNIQTVYGNLDESYMQTDEQNLAVEKGQELGTSGSSGWQETNSCLEFQVIDTANANCINPRVLMPRYGSEISLDFTDIVLIDRKENLWKLANQKYYPAGSYKIYKTMQKLGMPYKIIISLNGATVETISFDTVSEIHGQLCIKGNSFYPAQVFYPGNGRQLMGNVNLNKGKNTLSIIQQDITGAKKTLTYNIEVY